MPRPGSVVRAALPALVGAEPAPGGRQKITPQALWEMKRLGSPQVSPDGRTVVFTVQEWSIAKNRSTTTARIRGGSSRRALTTTSRSSTAP